MAPRESNCTMRSRPWMNSWYASKLGGWPAAFAQRLRRESNRVASAAITRCRTASTAASGCEIGPVPRRGNLDLEPDAVPLAIVGAPDHRAGTGLPAQCPKPGGVEPAGTVLRRCLRHRDHGHRGDDFDDAGLRQALRHPVGRHVTDVVERGVARVVLDHGDDDATLVEPWSATA